jgi:hypothetical protein
MMEGGRCFFCFALQHFHSHEYKPLEENRKTISDRYFKVDYEHVHNTAFGINWRRHHNKYVHH